MDHFEDRLVRIDEILALTGLSRTKLYDLIAEGTFPTQVRVGPRSVRWRLSEVLEWNRTRPMASEDNRS